MCFSSERVRFDHRPECYDFLPWCLVPDQNHKCLKAGFCFSGFECIPCISGFSFLVSVDRDGLDYCEEPVTAKLSNIVDGRKPVEGASRKANL